MKHKILTVIGAGIMGQGVSYQFAKFGFQVFLVDISEEILQIARTKIDDIHRFDLIMRRMNKSAKSDIPDPLSNITFVLGLEKVAYSDLVIENVPENFDTKAQVYRSIAPSIGDNTLVCVNSSATSVTKLSQLLNNPSNVLGMHFSNPVHLMPTVEMIRGTYTKDDTIAKAKSILNDVKMNAVVINDWPGFVTNRVMLMMVNEAIFCLQDGVGKAEDIDAISEKCLAHTMGPLKLADLIGLDTILYSLEVLLNNFNDSKYRPAPLLRKMVDAKLLGRKSGEGFYIYR